MHNSASSHGSITQMAARPLTIYRAPFAIERLGSHKRRDGSCAHVAQCGEGGIARGCKAGRLIIRRRAPQRDGERGARGAAQRRELRDCRGRQRRGGRRLRIHLIRGQRRYARGGGRRAGVHRRVDSQRRGLARDEAPRRNDEPSAAVGAAGPIGRRARGQGGRAHGRAVRRGRRCYGSLQRGEARQERPLHGCVKAAAGRACLRRGCIDGTGSPTRSGHGDRGRGHNGREG